MDTITVEQTEVAGFPAIVAQPPAGAARKDPILAVHGAFSDHRGFGTWLPLLAGAGYPTYAVARRGRLGIGPDDARGVRFADYLDDTMATIDAMPGEPVLLGHSLGGLLAQKAAEAGRGRALVLVSPAPPGMLTAQTAALPGYLPNVPKIMTGRSFLVGANACTRLALNQVPEADRPAIHATLVPESGIVYRQLMFGTVRVSRRKVTVPVFVVGGDTDRIISTRLLRQTARHYGVEPRILAGRGHWLLAEPGYPELVKEITTWLDGVR